MYDVKIWRKNLSMDRLQVSATFLDSKVFWHFEHLKSNYTVIEWEYAMMGSEINLWWWVTWTSRNRKRYFPKELTFASYLYYVSDPIDTPSMWLWIYKTWAKHQPLTLHEQEIVCQEWKGSGFFDSGSSFSEDIRM